MLTKSSQFVDNFSLCPQIKKIYLCQLSVSHSVLFCGPIKTKKIIHETKFVRSARLYSLIIYHQKVDIQVLFAEPTENNNYE